MCGCIKACNPCREDHQHRPLGLWLSIFYQRWARSTVGQEPGSMRRSCAGEVNQKHAHRRSQRLRLACLAFLWPWLFE